MRSCPYSDDQLILAARLYFADGLSQEEVARFVEVSQSKVSRMLALARERGIVRVTVPDYEPRSLALENALQTLLGIKAIVIRSAAGLEIEHLRRNVGYFGASAVVDWIKPARTVALAGGRTMQCLAEYMRPAAPVGEITFVQAMGHINSSPAPYDAVEVARTLAHNWQGRVLTLNTPAILPDSETCRGLLRLDQIRLVLEELAKADIAFVGIGTLENSVFVEHNALLLGDLRALRAAGAVGEILGRFYDSSGEECATALQHRVISLTLSELRLIPRRVGVLAGSDRTAAVLSAVLAGYVNALVTDERAAAALIKSARHTSERRRSSGGE